jgi:phage-related protein
MFSLEYFNAAVKAGIDAWPDGIRARYIALTLRMVEYGPNLGMPHTEALGGGLFEIRAKGHEGIGRAFYCALKGQRLVILHEFIKKSQKTPKRELRLARKRMKEIDR